MKKFKKILVMAMAFSLLLSSTVFASEVSEAEITTNETTLKDQVPTMLEQSFYSLEKEEIEHLKDNSVGYAAEAYESYLGIIDSLGEYDKIGEVKAEYNEEEEVYVVTADAVFKESNARAVMKVKNFSAGLSITEITFELVDSENTSFASKMGNAGINTLIGMGTVFIVLIFIAYLISLFKYIPKLVDKFSKKEEPRKEEIPAPVVTSAVEEDLTDDLELVAVITAAIAASEQTSADSFVVRSIKKSNKSKWQRA